EQRLTDRTYAVVDCGEVWGLQALQEAFFLAHYGDTQRVPGRRSVPETEDLGETPGTLWVWAPGLPKPLHRVSPVNDQSFSKSPTSTLKPQPKPMTTIIISTCGGCRSTRTSAMLPLSKAASATRAANY